MPKNNKPTGNRGGKSSAAASKAVARKAKRAVRKEIRREVAAAASSSSSGMSGAKRQQVRALASGIAKLNVRAAPQRGGLAITPAARAILKCLCAPDQTDPIAYGQMGTATTAPVRIHNYHSAVWSVGTSQPAGDSQDIGQLCGVVLKKDINCCAVLQVYKTGAFPQALFSNSQSTVSGQFLPAMDQYFPVRAAASLLANSTQEPVFYFKDVADVPMKWVNDDLANGTRNQFKATTLTTAFLTTKWYAVGYVRVIGGLVEEGILEAQVGGADVSSLAWDLPGAGYYVFYPSTTRSDGLTAAEPWSRADPYTLQITNPVAGHKWAPVQLSDNDAIVPAAISNVFSDYRTNAGSIIYTNATAPLQGEGLAIGCSLPKGTRFDHLFFGPTSSNTNPQPIASPFDAVARMRDARPKNAATGISEFLYFNGVDDLLSPENEDADDEWQATPSVVNASALTDGSVIVIKTGLANNLARDGEWQLHFHVEGVTQKQFIPQSGPTVFPNDIEVATTLQTRILSEADNPDHFATVMGRIRGVVKGGARITQAVAPAVGMAAAPFAAVPGGAIPAAVIGAGAAAATGIASLLDLLL